jgi:imidazolonepropionase-like amidohydrolase
MNGYRTSAMARTLLSMIAATLLLSACGEKLPDLVQLPATKPAALLIKNVAVLDVENGIRVSGRDVLVEGDKLTRIAPAGQVEAPSGAQEIDGSGATLLPGLIDMHSHLGNASAPRWKGELPDPPRNMQAYLYSGVTTVFDPGGLSNVIFKLRDDVASGELLGPRIYTAGPIVTAKGGHPVAVIDKLAPWWLRWYLIPRYTRQVETVAEARAAVRELADLKADAIKVVVDRIPEQTPVISDEALKALVDEASKHKLRTVAHIGTLQDAITAADAGVAMWIHNVYKERIPDEEIPKLAAYKIPMIPTIVVFEGYALLGRGPRASTPLERETVSADVLGAFDNPPQSEDSEFFRPYLQQLFLQRQAARDNVRRLHAAGVTILAGSDTQSGVFPGAGLHRELHLLQESGLTPAQVIRAATSDAARYLANGQEPAFGLIQEGKQADLLLVEGNPLENLDTLARIRAVIKGGIPLDRKPLVSSP